MCWTAATKSWSSKWTTVHSMHWRMATAAEQDRQRYFRERFRMQGELVKPQQWVVATGHKVVILFDRMLVHSSIQLIKYWFRFPTKNSTCAFWAASTTCWARCRTRKPNPRASCCRRASAMTTMCATRCRRTSWCPKSTDLICARCHPRRGGYDDFIAIAQRRSTVDGRDWQGSAVCDGCAEASRT